MTTVQNKAFLLGGLNYEANKEVAALEIDHLESDEILHAKPLW